MYICCLVGPFFDNTYMEELSYNIGTSACCRAACVACWKCSALRHSTTQPHHRQNKKMGRIREEVMGGGGIENIKNRGDERTQPALLLLSTSYPHISIYLCIYSFAYKHFYLFFFTFWRRRKREKKSLRKPWHSVVICAAATLYCFK